MFKTLFLLHVFCVQIFGFDSLLVQNVDSLSHYNLHEFEVVAQSVNTETASVIPQRVLDKNDFSIRKVFELFGIV